MDIELFESIYILLESSYFSVNMQDFATKCSTVHLLKFTVTIACYYVQLSGFLKWQKIKIKQLNSLNLWFPVQTDAVTHFPSLCVAFLISVHLVERPRSFDV